MPRLVPHHIKALLYIPIVPILFIYFGLRSRLRENLSHCLITENIFDFQDKKRIHIFGIVDHNLQKASHQIYNIHTDHRINWKAFFFFHHLSALSRVVKYVTVVKPSEKSYIVLSIIVIIVCSNQQHSQVMYVCMYATQIVDLHDIPEGGGSVAMSCSPGGQRGCVSLFLSIP